MPKFCVMSLSESFLGEKSGVKNSVNLHGVNVKSSLVCMTTEEENSLVLRDIVIRRPLYSKAPKTHLEVFNFSETLSEYLG